MNRRAILQSLAGGAVMAAGLGLARAQEPVKNARIEKLIVDAQGLPAIAQRIDFMSRALIGTRYRGYTLIGGPRQPEQIVMRDDAFDCVTFCETVLAAALVHAPDQFEAMLLRIRYHDSAVTWRERNHYFAEWSAHNIANRLLRPVVLPGSETIAKTLTEMRALGARPISFSAIPCDSLLANKALLATGDIIGFLSRRSDLDYFHIGFVVVAADGGLWLRHAAKSRGRVLDQPLARFLNANRVQAVTLLRAREAWSENVIV